MRFDDDSTDDGRPAADAPSTSEATSRTGRPLGRGLEDISHLFLSRPNATRVRAPESSRTPDDLHVRPTGRLGVPVLRAGEPISKSQLTATLTEYPGALDAGLSVVATGVPCPPYGDIDLIGVDRARQVFIVDVEAEPSGGLLLRGLSHIDWMVNHLPTVRNLCPQCAMDTTRRPGLFLVAPRFSSALRSAVRQLGQLGQLEIACFTYRDVAVAGGTAVFLERLGGGADRD